MGTLDPSRVPRSPSSKTKFLTGPPPADRSIGWSWGQGNPKPSKFTSISASREEKGWQVVQGQRWPRARKELTPHNSLQNLATGANRIPLEPRPRASRPSSLPHLPATLNPSVWPQHTLA
ncbi:hypothetical protein SUGI_0198350 [Cryptomeria japonica]|nr:hypothetical protein SUGI_0198350 [Cryptomeria japonica]